jgi:hypothetical protein
MRMVFFSCFMYHALTSSNLQFYDNKKIWKMKIPLKNKNKNCMVSTSGVILTKQNWHGSLTWVFYPQDETIKHLFFQYIFACSIWSVIQITLGLYPTSSIANIFGKRLHGIDYKYIILLRIGAMALIWSLWLCRNDKVFNNKIYLAHYLSLYEDTPYMVATSSHGGSWPLYGGVCVSRGYSYGPFFLGTDSPPPP